MKYKILKIGQSKLKYKNEETLKILHKKLKLKGVLKKRTQYVSKNINLFKVFQKINNTIDRVQEILRMYPSLLNLEIIILPGKKEVIQEFKRIYNINININYIAFFSRRENTIFLSLRHINIRVLAHEFSHAIVCAYFGKMAMPRRLDEIIAQDVEKYINN